VFLKVFRHKYFSKKAFGKSNTVCGVAVNRLFVNSDGSIALCPILNEKEHVIGHIKDNYKNIKKMWLNNRLLNYIRNKEYLNETCKKCKYLEYCYEGCIGKSWQEQNNYKKIDEWYCNKIQHVFKR